MQHIEVPAQRTKSAAEMPLVSDEEPSELLIPIVSEVVIVDVATGGRRGCIAHGSTVRVDLGDRPTWDLITDRPAQRIAGYVLHASRVQVSGSDPDAVAWFSRELRGYLHEEAQYQRDAMDKERVGPSW